MKIDNRYFLVVFILFVFYACGSGDKDRYIVETDFENSNSVPFILVQENIEKGLLLDTLVADNGFLLFESKADSLSKLSFYIWGYSHPLPIYVINSERYELKGDINNPYAIEVSGSSLNQSLSAFRIEHAELFKTLYDIDTLITSSVRDSVKNALNDAVIREIIKKPSQTSSAILLADYLCKYDQHQLVDSLYQLLSPKAIPSFVSKKVEQFLSLTQKRATQDTMYTFTAINNRDSLIHTGSFSNKPTIYLFWSMRDSLPNLVACRDMSILYKNFHYYDLEWVSVSLDSDTALWRKKLVERSIDSLGVQLNVPMGLSSAIADSIGLLSLPFYIVQDSTGVIYSKGISGEAFLTSFEKVLLPHILSDSALIDSAMTNSRYRRNVLSRAAGGFYQ